MQLTRFGLILALVVPATAAAVAACSSSSSSGGTGDDGGSGEAATGQDSGGGSDSGGGTDSGGGDSGPVVCNNLQPASTAVQVQGKSGTAPAPTGGSIGDGTYVASAAVLYLGSIDAGGASLGQTDTRMQIQGTTVNVAQTSKGTVTSETDTFSVAGDSITITPTCPSGKTGTTAHFSARAPDADAGVPNGGFDLIVTEKGLTAVLTLAKQ